MFTPAHFRELMHRHPFVPIRVVTSAGETFDIIHPELIMVGQHYLIIGRAAANDPMTFDLESRVALSHVTAVHDLLMSSGTTNNGGGT